MTGHNAETPVDGSNHQAGALEKGASKEPFHVNATTTPQKIKGFIIECLLAAAAVPAVLLLAPLLALAVGGLIGKVTS